MILLKRSLISLLLHGPVATFTSQDFHYLQTGNNLGNTVLQGWESPIKEAYTKL